MMIALLLRFFAEKEDLEEFEDMGDRSSAWLQRSDMQIPMLELHVRFLMNSIELLAADQSHLYVCGFRREV